MQKLPRSQPPLTHRPVVRFPPKLPPRLCSPTSPPPPYSSSSFFSNLPPPPLISSSSPPLQPPTALPDTYSAAGAVLQAAAVATRRFLMRCRCAFDYCQIAITRVCCSRLTTGHHQHQKLPTKALVFSFRNPKQKHSFDLNACSWQSHRSGSRKARPCRQCQCALAGEVRSFKRHTAKVGQVGSCLQPQDVGSGRVRARHHVILRLFLEHSSHFTNSSRAVASGNVSHE